MLADNPECTCLQMNIKSAREEQGLLVLTGYENANILAYILVSAKFSFTRADGSILP